MAAPEYLANVDASLTRLIKDGAIFIREAGTTDIPTGTDWTPADETTQIGYYSEDGFTLASVPGDNTDFFAHNGDVVQSDQQPGWYTAAFSGIESNENVTAAYFDIDVDDIGEDGSVTITSAANSKRYDLVLAGLDQNDNVIIAHLPNVQISERGDIVFNRTTLLAYALTFRTFKGDEDAPYHIKAWGLVPTEGS